MKILRRKKNSRERNIFQHQSNMIKRKKAIEKTTVISIGCLYASRVIYYVWIFLLLNRKKNERKKPTGNFLIECIYGWDIHEIAFQFQYFPWNNISSSSYSVCYSSSSSGRLSCFSLLCFTSIPFLLWQLFIEFILYSQLQLCIVYIYQ